MTEETAHSQQMFSPGGTIPPPDRYPDPYARPFDTARQAPDQVGADDEAEPPPRDWSGISTKARQNQVTIAAAALIVASLIWKAVFLSNYFFRQDDFWLMDYAVRDGLAPSLVGHVWSGQFIPGVYVVGWLQVKLALYSWALGACVELIFIAAASLAAWRLFRRLIGNRPALLIPLALYVLSPLAFQQYSWWISAVETVPMQLAIFASLDAHLSYVWTRRLRDAVLAAFWLAFGVFFFEKSALIPLLLFAVTVGFVIRRRSLLSAAGRALVDYWRAWALYVGVLTVYAIFFFLQLGKQTAQPSAPPSAHLALTFGWGLVFHTLVPGLLGGPWHWYVPAGAAGGNSAPPQDLAWLALLVVLGVIIASLLTRRRAWRGWAILLGWLILDDIVPVVIGRVANYPQYTGILDTQTRYVMDMAAVFAIVVALIFWPLDVPEREPSEANGPRREFFGSVNWRRAAIVLVTVFALGSFWSVSQYQAHTTTAAAREYIGNARLALANVPAGTTVLDRPVPSTVMVPLYKTNSNTSVVVGPLAPAGTHIHWVAQPSGNAGIVRMFGPDGKLYFAAISGVTGQSRSTFAQCITPTKSTLVVKLPARPGFGPYVRVLRIDYLASSDAAGTSLTVRYNQTVSQLPIMAKLQNAYFAVTGAATQVTLQALLSAGTFCFEKAVAGYFVPLPGSGVPKGQA